MNKLRYRHIVFLLVTSVTSHLSVALLQQRVLLSSGFQVLLQPITVHTVHLQSGLSLQADIE